jgi:6-phosphogluconolactonase
LAHEAAELFSALALDAVRDHSRFSVALSGGGTPQALFSLLARPPCQSVIPWQQTHFFWADERLVPPDDPGSNYYHAARLLLDHVPIPTTNIHRMKGELSPEKSVLDYSGQLHSFAANGRSWPRFDLVLLGMGSDGHTASLFPGSPIKEAPGISVKAVTAQYEDRPSQRITLTAAVINDARRVIFLVTGANKAATLSAVLQGPRDLAKLPAQRIQPISGTLTWLVDQAAASAL